MTEQHAETDDRTPDNSTPDGSTVPEPNTRPGPTDQGGHGGMATREQEARLRRRQSAGEAADGEGDGDGEEDTS